MPNNFLTLNDLRATLMPDGSPVKSYAELLAKENEILERAEKFLNEGAEILDLGAESTRPGATRISEAEELERLLPALKIVRKNFPDAAISIDTYKSETAKIAFNEGADIINDVSGFCLDDEMINFVNT